MKDDYFKLASAEDTKQTKSIFRMSLDQLFWPHLAPTDNTTQQTVHCRCCYSLGPIKARQNGEYFQHLQRTADLPAAGPSVWFLLAFTYSLLDLQFLQHNLWIIWYIIFSVRFPNIWIPVTNILVLLALCSNMKT